ncbi:hypothetical protein LCGC14_1249110 [marine sediment metagenome]|uniref:HisA/hisF family protein n=1 Tax=marine sediment metagenome TaxID=412755 RepID=A0A0F9NKW2_9ZZZZ|nr:hypothetical protein [archaeon]HEC37886.1 hypothetical protein [bacterium]
MNRFKIIPVIDILNSRAVHAIKGDRENYKPLKSGLFETTDPTNIIKTLNKKYNFNEFYIADLDSILKKKLNIQILKQIGNIENVKIIIDPGIVTPKEIKNFTQINFRALILGLETIKNLKTINKSIEFLGINKVIVSIDMYKGKILSNAKEFKNYPMLNVIEKIEMLGVKTLILLDLFRVGLKLGGVPQLYIDILQNFNGDIYVGGGIKNLNDILQYKDEGFSGVLIATALYDGTIEIEKLKVIN